MVPHRQGVMATKIAYGIPFQLMPVSKSLNFKEMTQAALRLEGSMVLRASLQDSRFVRPFAKSTVAV
ncbi:hypothetical protein PpSQ1_24835, partial [Pseudomonas putida]